MLRIILLIFPLVLFLGACQQSQITLFSWTPPPTQTRPPTHTPRPSPTPRPTNTQAPWQLSRTPQPSPTQTPTNQPTPTNPTQTPTQTQTPTNQPTQTPTNPTPTQSNQNQVTAYFDNIEIKGTLKFTQQIQASLQFIKTNSPQDYSTIAFYTQTIKESHQNYTSSDSLVMQISTSTANYGSNYSSSLILHEAVHWKNWFTRNLPAWGCEGEKKSLRAQADYLRKIKEEDLAKWAESQMGVWGC